VKVGAANPSGNTNADEEAHHADHCGFGGKQSVD